MKTTMKLLLATAICMLAASSSNASTMNYGTFTGATVDFIDVTEDNLLPSSLLYDVQGTVGDILLIDPNSFGVQQNPGPGTNLVDSELQMMVAAHDGGSVDMISFHEEGDYTILGNGNVQASIAYFWDILEVDHSPISPVSGSGSTSFQSTTNTSGGLWDIGFNVDLNASLADAGMSGTVTKVKFTFDNTLTASADDASSVAFIKKKQFGGVQISVPEPAGIFTGLIGMVGLLGLRRR